MNVELAQMQSALRSQGGQVAKMLVAELFEQASREVFNCEDRDEAYGVIQYARGVKAALDLLNQKASD